MLSLCTIANYLGSQSQDEHNASSFFVCFGKSCLNPITKIEDFPDNPLSSNVLFIFGMDFRGILYSQPFILSCRSDS